MARAKSTARAEARRRYRQATAGDPAEELIETGPEGGEDTSTAAPARPARAAAKPAAAAPARPSITYAFRAAYRPANLREDIALLPKLLLSRAFLAGAGLMAVGTALVIAQPSGPLSAYALQIVVIPPALAPVFVTGFFAPRASYLLGLILGVVNAILYSAVIGAISPLLPAGTDLSGQVAVAIATAPFSGLLFASAAAWYRRFLQLSNPRPQTGARAKANARDGRTRTAKTTTKPAPKR